MRMRTSLFVSRVSVLATLRDERPLYGKKPRRPYAFSPRIAARQKMAKLIWRKNSFAPYRIMMLRRLWKPTR